MATSTKNKYTYVLRTCSEDVTSRNGFKWPQKGLVKCNDWSKEPKCDNGLHGLLIGSGDGELLDWDASAQWLVVKVLVQDVVVIDQDQVKFPKGTVVYCGDRKGATDYIIAHGADASKVVGAFITVGDGGVGGGSYGATVSGGDWAKINGGYRTIASGGYGAKVSGGDYATVSGGCRAKVSGGDYATVSGGVGAIVSGGDRAIVSGGARAKVSGGDRATVSGGDYATVSGGNLATVNGGNLTTVSGGIWAKVSGGYRAKVSGGDGAKVSGGYRAKVSGGDGAILQVLWYDGTRHHITTACVGEDGIEANVMYKVNDKGKFVKA